MSEILSLFTNLPSHLQEWTIALGPWFYVLIFAIIFAETGLIVTPFLPGDSFLFALGSVVAMNSEHMNLWFVMALLIVAAVLGDAVNFKVGGWFRPKLQSGVALRFINPKHLERTHQFFIDHGGKTIFLARFMPIVRTYAPFVAGVGQMPYRYFAFYNVIGAVVWITSFCLLGFYFGQLPVVKKNFSLLIVAIVVISFLPVVYEYLRALKTTSRPSNKPTPS